MIKIGYKSSIPWKILKKALRQIAKALPILPIILGADYLMLWILAKYNLGIDATLKGTFVNAFVSVIEIIVVLIYADLIGILGFNGKKRRRR